MADMVESTIEIGRFYTIECGYYLIKMLAIKSGYNVKYVIMDVGMNHMNYLGLMIGMKISQIVYLKMDEYSALVWRRTD